MQKMKNGQDSIEIKKPYGGFKRKTDDHSQCKEPKICENTIAETPAKHEERQEGRDGGNEWDLDIRKPDKSFERRDVKRYCLDEKQPDCPVGKEIQETMDKDGYDRSDKNAWNTDIREPDNSFKCKEVIDLKRSNPLGEKNVMMGGQSTADFECLRKPDIKVIVDMLVQRYVFICIKGQDLYMKENNIYTWISPSREMEIMYLKSSLKEYGMNLCVADCKTVLGELKTEPGIWVKSLEPSEDGQYNIAFFEEGNLTGVEGRFDDFIFSGQIKNKWKPFTEGIQMFVAECCSIIRDVRIGSTALYNSYTDFMNENPDFLLAKQNQFVPYVKQEFGLHSGSTGRKRVIIGICLKEY